MSPRVTNAPDLSTTATRGGFVPAQRPAPEASGPRHVSPTVSGLAAEALMLVRRDQIPVSGYLVSKRQGRVVHRHEVWMLGPFALLGDGWFGQVLGPETGPRNGSRWVRRNQDGCDHQHWTRFVWLDPATLQPGCGTEGVGLGLGADGPTYCAGHAETDPLHPSHVALADVMRAGLRALAVGTGN